MAAVDLLAGTVMDKAASLLNDTSKSVYTYVAVLPYLQMAIQELQEYFELHNVPVTETASTVISMPIGSSEIVYNAGGVLPRLPNDFVEPLEVWERNTGINPYIPMRRVDFIPLSIDGVDISQFSIYAWQSQKILVPPANQANEIKINYVKELFTNLVDQTSIINVVNARTFLEYRTAALCAEFIERNKPSSDGLNIYAGLALDRVTGIGVKGKQTIMTRRRPFRASYKRGSVG